MDSSIEAQSIVLNKKIRRKTTMNDSIPQFNQGGSIKSFGTMDRYSK